MKKSKNSTLLRQISQLEAEVIQLRETFHNNMVLFHNVNKKEKELEEEEYYRNKYFQLIWRSRTLCSEQGYLILTPGERKYTKKVCRKQMRKESKKIISEGLIDHELITSILHESWALDDMYAESLADFMESEYQREWEREQELQERYEEWAGINDDWAGPDEWSCDDIDGRDPYYGF